MRMLRGIREAKSRAVWSLICWTEGKGQRMVVDYRINMLWYGKAEVPTAWIYNGEYLKDQITYDPYAFACLQAGERNILVDCGANMADPAKQAIFGAPVYHCLDMMSCPEEALGLVGLLPEDITDVVLTHAHMDHMGSLELWPNAQFYLQKDELEGWEGVVADPMMKGALTPNIVDPGDIERARALVDEGRMTLLEGDVTDLLPGIDVHVMRNCHSNADQMVAINTPDGCYLYVGDLCTREAHMVGIEGAVNHYGWQRGSSGSAYLALHQYAHALELADGDISHVLIPHEYNYLKTRYVEGKADEGRAVSFRIR